MPTAGATNAMAELNVDVARLPEDVREKLAELELELSEGKYSFYFFVVGQYRFFSPSHPQVPTMAPRPPSNTLYIILYVSRQPLYLSV